LLAFDTETTGIDLFHGAKPFLVTTYDGESNQWWEWDVNPLTRQPEIPKRDKVEIKRVIRKNSLVLHNSKFDAHGMDRIGVPLNWSTLDDTLLMAHLVDSKSNKDLTTLTLVHLGINVQPFEDRVEDAVKKARTYCKKQYPDWRLAKEGLSDMPSIKQSSERKEDKPWKNDMWILRALAQEENYSDDHHYWSLCSEYANSDTFSTYHLRESLWNIIKERGLEQLYYERLKVLPIIFDMEVSGLTASKSRFMKLRSEYTEKFNRQSQRCLNIAEALDYDLELPKSGLNNSLRNFCFSPGNLSLPVVKKTKSGNASLDKESKQHYILTETGVRQRFIQALDIRSKLGTALGYMDSYAKFMLPTEEEYTVVLHSSLNLTGTKTLRTSSQNPNQQQISKQAQVHDHSLRYIFGPPRGYLWASIDYDNLELRIPAYESKEPAMLALFEQPDSAPFFGSYHLLIVSILHSKEWKLCIKSAGPNGAGELFRKEYKSDLYQWTKNGNFADLYGAVDRQDGLGTADKAFHVPGAQSIIAGKLQEKSKLNQKYINFANTHGYVETLPDKEIDPDHGYPLQCEKSKWGKVLPTVPLNYHVQGTACWVKMRAMIKCQEYIKQFKGWRIVMDVHDEIVFEFPENGPWKSRLRKVKRLMESMGECIGVKLTCGVDIHRNNWSQVDQAV